MNSSKQLNENQGAKNNGVASDYEVHISAGGVTSLMAGVGFQLAAHVAGISKWRQVHGASGGSIVGALIACGYSPQELLHITLDLKFRERVSIKRGIFAAPFTDPLTCTRAVRGYGDEWRECQWYGLLGTESLGDTIAAFQKQAGLESWPSGYSCIATSRYGDPILFNEHGATLFRDGERLMLSDEPLPLPLAVRASCSIGGVMVPLSYKGNVLFDGGLSRYGYCPVGLHIEHFGRDPKKMIAIRCNEIHPTTLAGRLHRAARWVWRTHPDSHWGPETAGVIELHPPIQHTSTLRFHLSSDEKWLAVLLAFNDALSVLALHGLLTGENLERARTIISELGFWRDFQPNPLGKPQYYTHKVKAVFAKHGLY